MQNFIKTYKKIILFLDPITYNIVFYILKISFELITYTRFMLEDYGLKRGYSLSNQFEKVLTPQAENMILLMIDKKDSYPEIYKKIFELSKGALNLSKRQCYNLKKKRQLL